jgi:hypothetical protein
LEELAGSCASRATSASLDFFAFFVLWVTVIFLMEDLVTLGASAESSVSCAEGLSRITARGEGATVASGCGSLSSLQIGNRFYATRKKEIKDNETRGNTYEAIRSKNLTPSSRKGASTAAVFCAEVLKDVKSSTHFLFLSAPVSSDSAGGGDIIELVSSSDSSASSPS